MKNPVDAEDYTEQMTSRTSAELVANPLEQDIYPFSPPVPQPGRVSRTFLQNPDEIREDLED